MTDAGQNWDQGYAWDQGYLWRKSADDDATWSQGYLWRKTADDAPWPAKDTSNTAGATMSINRWVDQE
jgi:hypothetical protein